MYFCSVEDVQAFAGRNRWNKRHLTYRISGSLSSLPSEEMSRAFEIAWARISDVCGMTAEETRGKADIFIHTGRIDGPNGTLAWSQLANGTDRPLEQKYDAGDRWGIFDDHPRREIDLARVACHELIHALGVSHISGELALMNPSYGAVIKPQDADIRELRDRYGPPKKTQPPVDPDKPLVVELPPGTRRIILELDYE